MHQKFFEDTVSLKVWFLGKENIIKCERKYCIFSSIIRTTLAWGVENSDRFSRGSVMGK